MENRIPPFLKTPATPLPDARMNQAGSSFVDAAIRRMGALISATYAQWETASRRGLMQAMDSRLKLVCLLFLLVVGTVRNAAAPGLVLSGGLFLLVCLSRLNPIRFYGRIFVLVFLFGFLVVLPASLNVVTDGRVVLPLLRLKASHTIWLYTIPETVGITREGLSVVGLFSLRMANCLSICLLLLHTTPFPRIMRSLKVFRVPDVICVVFALTYKYIFIFSKMVESIYLARKSRSAGRPARGEAGAWAAGRIALLFRKTQGRCEDVFQAMLSRGPAQSVTLAASDPPGRFDIVLAASIISFGTVLLWM